MRYKIRLTLKTLLAISLSVTLQGVVSSHPLEFSYVEISKGPFLKGSTRQEREQAYQLDAKAYGHNITRENGWYEQEFKQHSKILNRYLIFTNLVTNSLYAQFVMETSTPAPQVTEKEWNAYGLIHPFSRTQKFIWHNSTYKQGRESHPVVLVSWNDASNFARWYSKKTDHKWMLPTEDQWEKAARGTSGRIFPWGDAFESHLLNSHDQGPFDTLPVGIFPKGQSPYGMMDAAGQVFEWTRTSARVGRYIVKGGSWDDKGCGVCRPAARHSRQATLKHILIGFRLVSDQSKLD